MASQSLSVRQNIRAITIRKSGHGQASYYVLYVIVIVIAGLPRSFEPGYVQKGATK